MDTNNYTIQKLLDLLHDTAAQHTRDELEERFRELCHSLAENTLNHNNTKEIQHDRNNN